LLAAMSGILTTICRQMQCSDRHVVMNAQIGGDPSRREFLRTLPRPVGTCGLSRRRLGRWLAAGASASVPAPGLRALASGVCGLTAAHELAEARFPGDGAGAQRPLGVGRAHSPSTEPAWVIRGTSPGDTAFGSSRLLQERPRERCVGSRCRQPEWCLSTTWSRPPGDVRFRFMPGGGGGVACCPALTPTGSPRGSAR